MAGKLTILARAITRRVNGRRLVVRFTPEGVELRGFRKHTWRRVTWEQIAVLADAADDVPLIKLCEENAGRRVLESIGAAEDKGVTND